MRRLTDEHTLIQLSGFNNLTKSLSFNLYDFCIARDQDEMESYARYIQAEFNAARITEVLHEVTRVIEANVIAESRQDYDPWGASAMLLLSDIKGSVTSQESVALHLDKSHICAHTYPDFRSKGAVCSFRIDIEISTCGEISPLSALNFLLEAFYSDVVIIDYKVRGFTRDHERGHVFIDHAPDGITRHIKPELLESYDALDLALPTAKIWQKKMIRTVFEEREYFRGEVNLSDPEHQRLLALVREEMRAVFLT